MFKKLNYEKYYVYLNVILFQYSFKSIDNIIDISNL